MDFKCLIETLAYRREHFSNCTVYVPRRPARTPRHLCQTLYASVQVAHDVRCHHHLIRCVATSPAFAAERNMRTDTDGQRRAECTSFLRVFLFLCCLFSRHNSLALRRFHHPRFFGAMARQRYRTCVHVSNRIKRNVFILMRLMQCSPPRSDDDDDDNLRGSMRWRLVCQTCHICVCAHLTCVFRFHPSSKVLTPVYSQVDYTQKRERHDAMHRHFYYHAPNLV